MTTTTFTCSPPDWETKSSYCGGKIPSHLDRRGAINWLKQKTEQKPYSEQFSKKENQLRSKERWEMRILLIKLGTEEIGNSLFTRC